MVLPMFPAVHAAGYPGATRLARSTAPAGSNTLPVQGLTPHHEAQIPMPRFPAIRSAIALVPLAALALSAQ